jgi:RNA-directed DNA polymerase
MHNLSFGLGRESAGFIVAWKRSNVRGAKGPCQVRAWVREREVRLDSEDPILDSKESPTTERRRLPSKLSLLRHKLSQKAKQEPKFRFYTLYDRIYRWDTLLTAWNQVARNLGAAGVDGVTIQQIASSGDDEVSGIIQFLSDLQKELQEKRYQPQPVRRVYIPKTDGKLRPLGIPTVKDRVVQAATLLILEPIFEADFLDCSYGFRPERSAHQALKEIHANLTAGYREVYDADLQGYFDSIPHDKLMACLRMRIADRTMLKLIRMWLETPVVEETEDNQTKITRSKQGTPQGGVISPLLANIYLHWFDKRFHATEGPAQWAKARLVRYADDFVVMARYQGPQLVSWVEGILEDWLGLKINRNKTRIVNLKEEGTHLDFLGYQFRYDRNKFGSGTYLNWGPSAKSVTRELAKLTAMTASRQGLLPIDLLITKINRHLKGWMNYFELGYPRKAFRKIGHHARDRMVRHLRRRSQRPYRKPEDRSWYRTLADLGLLIL